MDTPAHQLNSYLDRRYGNDLPVDNSELEERISDFMDNRKNFSDVVDCDIELMYGLIHSIYNAVESGNMGSACLFSRSIHSALKEKAEKIVRAM